jgi:hypothetical protein
VSEYYQLLLKIRTVDCSVASAGVQQQLVDTASSLSVNATTEPSGDVPGRTLTQKTGRRREYGFDGL